MRYFLYQIKNTINEKIYIGKAKNTNQRWKEHLRNVKNGKQHPLYDAIRKYGVECFEFTILTETTSDLVDDLEKDLINKQSQYPIGYNLAKGGEGGDTFSYLPDDIKTKRREKLRVGMLNNPRGISTHSTKGKHITETCPDIKKSGEVIL